MQRNRERHLAILFEQSGNVGIDQHDAGVREFSARGLGDGFNVAIEPAPQHRGNPKALPRNGSALAIGVLVMTESSSATSITVRPIGPTVSRVWLIGTTMLASS